MSKVYSPRCQSKRWLDSDCPKGVLAIYDNKGKSADRYTVFYTEPVAGTTYANMWIGYRDMCDNPTSPQGISLYSEMLAYQVEDYRYRFKHQATKWSSLPDAVKKCVFDDLSD